MFIIYILTLFLVVYSSIVAATYKKFQRNGIGFNIKYKLLLSMLPLYLVYLHSKIARKIYKEDKKKAVKVFVVVVTKYPIIVGGIIELLLESAAECNVIGSSELLSIKQKKIKRERTKKSIMPKLDWSFEKVFAYFKKDSNYEDTVLGNLVY